MLQIASFLMVERVPIQVRDDSDIYEVEITLQGDSITRPILLDGTQARVSAASY